MKAFIIYNRFYNFKENKIYIGGVETYIYNLIKVLKEYISEIVIIQYEELNIEKEIELGVRVVGIPKVGKHALVRCAERMKNSKDDILLFASSALLTKNSFEKSIAIQHGIYWDMNYIHGIYNIPENISIILRCLESILEIRKQKYTKQMVCVDYNYINWYRTQSVARRLNYTVIPNFVKSTRINEKRIGNDKISIVYARRFEVTRGVDLICNVMPKLLKKYDNISFTIAGSGSKESELRKQFDGYDNVIFTKYTADNGVEFHQDFDIALVPSIGSEGTSLSLLEGMQAGCAVVGTDIGGITNILLDGYNGLIISPRENELMKALEQLIVDSEYRIKLAENGKRTVQEAFSYENWCGKWRICIEELIDEK